ncbi:MAG: class I SAM-dependent methyltransferase [Chloroflexota bacterium]
MMENISQSNRRYWDALASDWQSLRDQDQLWRRCPRQPELAFEGEALAFIHKFVGSLQGRRALVIGSGDNYVAFALSGLGARATSSDISSRQLDIARQRAGQLGLEIEFVCADAAGLEGIQDNSFDLVCSSNGFFVWIADPARVFQAVQRVLRPGGFYIFYDIHPLMRPWKNLIPALEMEKPYSETGPFEHRDNEETSYEFHWRLSDLFNAMCDAGLVLRQVAESPAQDARFWEGHAYPPGLDRSLLDWRANPRAGLPVWLTVAACKPG